MWGFTHSGEILKHLVPTSLGSLYFSPLDGGYGVEQQMWSRSETHDIDNDSFRRPRSDQGLAVTCAIAASLKLQLNELVCSSFDKQTTINHSWKWQSKREPVREG